MTFHEDLLQATAAERQALTAVPIIQACLAGDVALDGYIAFLTQAWHHVRHTVPLMRECKAALPARLQWMQLELDEYIEEEEGHDEWILDDLSACGVARGQVIGSAPAFATELMIAYAYDTIHRRNPVGFLGMVHVLEGTSVALALSAARQIQDALRLPASAFSYLRSHGTLDRQHVAHFAELVNRLDDPTDRADVVHAARAFYRLYADVFRSLPLPVAVRAPAPPARAAA